MELKDFVESLPYETFDELRKVVVVRHSREAAELMKLVIYLKENKSLEAVMTDDPHELIRHLMDTQQVGPEVCIRALNRFVALKQQEENNGSGDTNTQLYQELRNLDKESESG